MKAFTKNVCIDLKCREMRSKVIFGHPKGGGGHHNGQPVNHSGIYTVFALAQTNSSLSLWSLFMCILIHILYVFTFVERSCAVSQYSLEIVRDYEPEFG